MLQKNFHSHKDKNYSPRDFRFELKLLSEQVADFQTYSRQNERNSPYYRYRNKYIYPPAKMRNKPQYVLTAKFYRLQERLRRVDFLRKRDVETLQGSRKAFLLFGKKEQTENSRLCNALHNR